MRTDRLHELSAGAASVLAAAAETKDFRPLQDALEAWTATVRLQRQPGYEAMIQRMQRRERGVPVDLDELRRSR